MNMKYKDGFKCDVKSKGILKDLIVNNWFSSCTIQFDEENEMDEYARVDTLFTAYTKNGNQYAYAIESKERKGYNHNDYNEWMIEQHKLEALKQYKDYGYKSFYFNLFKDGYYYIWDVNTIENSSQSLIPVTPHTQSSTPECKIMQKRIMIKANNAILSGRTKN